MKTICETFPYASFYYQLVPEKNLVHQMDWRGLVRSKARKKYWSLVIDQFVQQISVLTRHVMISKFFYNKMDIKMRIFFLKKMFKTTLGAEPCRVRKRLLTFHSSKPCKHRGSSPLNGMLAVQITLMHNTLWHRGLQHSSATIENNCFLCPVQI